MRRISRRMDGRNPYGSRGGYVVSNKRGRRDRGMEDYGRYDRNYQDVNNQPYYNANANYDNANMNYDRGYYPMDMPYNRPYDYNNYDMRSRDYGRYDYGDYGETLTDEEIKHWTKKLMREVPEKDKAFFTEENIITRARSLGATMQNYGEKEFYVTTLMMYAIHCDTIGQNMDIYLKLAKEWLEYADMAVKGAEKLATFYDCIVIGDDE